MCKFIKLVIKRKDNEFRNIQYLSQIIKLYQKFSKYLHDDFFIFSKKSSVDAVIDLIERTSPFFWIIEDKNSGKFAGFVYLDNWVGSNLKSHSAEVTTCFEPAFWGKYTKKCARRFIKYCFAKYKLEKLKAYIFPQNFRVRELLKKAGFKKEALLKSETVKNGVLQNIEVFSVLK